MKRFQICRTTRHWINNTTIRRLIKRGMEKEDIVDTVLKGYKGTERREHWRKVIRKHVGIENAEMKREKRGITRKSHRRPCNRKVNKKRRATVRR